MFTHAQWENMWLIGQELPVQLRERAILEAFQNLPAYLREQLIKDDFRGGTTEEERMLWLGFLLYAAENGKLFNIADYETAAAVDEIKPKLTLIKGNKGEINMSIETAQDYIITLSKPYTFEGETYKELDLQGLHDLKAKDLCEIEKIYLIGGGNPAFNALTLGYALIVAQKVTKKPLEFFNDLPAKDTIALKNEITNFFYGEESISGESI